MLTKQSVWRALFSALVGGMGGVSLTVTIMPVVLAQLLGHLSLEALVNMRSSVLLMGLLWGIGGGMVGWLGGARTGTLVMGLCGVITGLFLGAFAGRGDLTFTLIAVGIGLLYGLPGGLIMGKVFPAPARET